jgi:hypothetical protein
VDALLPALEDWSDEVRSTRADDPWTRRFLEGEADPRLRLFRRLSAAYLSSSWTGESLCLLRALPAWEAQTENITNTMEQFVGHEVGHGVGDVTDLESAFIAKFGKHKKNKAFRRDVRHLRSPDDYTKADREFLAKPTGRGSMAMPSRPRSRTGSTRTRSSSSETRTMRLAAAWVLTGLVSCGTPPESRPTRPPESPARAACQASTGEVEALERDLDEIDAALQRGTAEDLQHAVEHTAVLLEHPVFHTNEGRPAIVAPSNPRALLDWWERGARSWIESRLRPWPTNMEVPPGVRSVVDPDAVPGEIACAEPACDPLASRFFETVVASGLELEQYRRHRVLPSIVLTGSSANREQSRCVGESASTWLDCISCWRSAPARLPIGDFRFPTSGWMFVSVGGQVTSECPTQMGLSLESGDMLVLRDCQLHAGRGSVERAREFALVALLAHVVEEVPEWGRHTAPEGVDLTGTCAVDGGPPPHRTKSSAHAALRYWWWRDGAVVAERTLRPTSYEEPASGLAMELLDVAEYTLGEAVGASLPALETDDDQLAQLVSALRGG